jgi:hypothetical protein
MKVEIGNKGLKNTHQEEFPETTECFLCSETSRIAFVAFEEDEDKYICELHKNIPDKKYWPHDAIAVAVYFCSKCFHPQVIWNQA